MNSGPPPNPAAGFADRKRFSSLELYAFAFGLFLGLALIKFGNPVILDGRVLPPASWPEAWREAWPPHWANWLLAPLAVLGGVLAFLGKARWPASRWLWVLPAVWLGWQFVSATQSVDRPLTALTLWQLAGCVICFCLGALVLGRQRGLNFLMFGVLAAFTFCLIRAVEQRLFEFPAERQVLLEGERVGWTNVPPDVFQDWKRAGFIINTNGVDVANPIILAKYEKKRVHGTLVYPNALAGIVLLLAPIYLALAFKGTGAFRKAARVLAVGLTVALVAAGLIWSGSKSGWLIAIALGILCVWRRDWSRRLKWGMLFAVLILGLVLFGVRFRNYFAKGATSVGARFDYWRVAARITAERPLLGSGPGTFQRPYALMKSPDAEMARLTHNDFLQQFSDSGIVGGGSYLAWIALLLWTTGRRCWRSADWWTFPLFLGLLGWFAQGTVEFGLYVPALAWTAFTLGGCLLVRDGGGWRAAPSAPRSSGATEVSKRT